jgi:hypothetical protein
MNDLHRVDAFFVFHPHANRLLHCSSFMSSLSLPPSHPKFPAAPVLHAICAIGSLYTAAVTSPPLPNFAEVEPGMVKHPFFEFLSDSYLKMKYFRSGNESRRIGLIHSQSSRADMPRRQPIGSHI